MPCIPLSICCVGFAIFQKLLTECDIKLQTYSICGTCLNWFERYLIYNRKQSYVILQQQRQCRFTQGSVHGPIIFIILLFLLLPMNEGPLLRHFLYLAILTMCQKYTYHKLSLIKFVQNILHFFCLLPPWHLPNCNQTSVSPVFRPIKRCSFQFIGYD